MTECKLQKYFAISGSFIVLFQSNYQPLSLLQFPKLSKPQYFNTTNVMLFSLYFEQN